MAEYHTNRDDLYGARQRGVYHDKQRCTDGKRIERGHRTAGRSVGRTLCSECSKVSS